jgi:peptidoglycan/xylan/chitin deacetylase (PgdA/CDA1 family)
MSLPSQHGPTVCLTPDFDAVCLWMSWGARGARSLSRGEFGARVGTPRLLELFARCGVESTWFIPGHTAETFPEPTAAIAAAGHEIGNHGYVHEAFDRLSEDEVRAVIRKSNDALERITGQRPGGIRVPAGDFDQSLFEILIDEGFTYDSSLLGPDDYRPTWCRGADVLNDSGPNVLGPSLDLVEFPIGFITNDFNQFEFNYANPQLVGYATPGHVYDVWTSEFDYMVDSVPDGVLVVTLHPQCIGHGGRIAMLERFIEHCTSRGARFAKLATAAAEFRAAETAVVGRSE